MDPFCFGYRLSAFHALQNHMVQPLLLFQQRIGAARSWFNHSYVTIEAGFFVQDLNHPSNEGPEEVATAKLQYAQRESFLAVNLIAG
jgi:hypothetical protein